MRMVTNTMGQHWMKLLAAGLCVAGIAVACGGDDSRSRAAIRGRAKTDPATTAGGGGGASSDGAMKKIDPATAGTISGVVRWGGAAVTPEPLDLSGNADCAKSVKTTMYKEDLVVSADNLVANAFLSIDTADIYEAPTEAAVVDQIGCQYFPHVFGVMSGQKLKIKSSDSLLHNVHYLPTGELNTEENFAMPNPATRERTFQGNDWIKFKCDVHPWMGAWCAVRTHPFFAVSGVDGKFTIANVPAGTHKLVLKHSMLGEQSASVTVEAGKVATQEFTLKK